VPNLYVIATGARAAGDLPSILPLLIELGWTCCVTLTPAATTFVDQAVLERLSGLPVPSIYRRPDESEVHPPADAFLVAPLTFNSMNRWSDGHSDTLATGLLNEGIGLGVPIVAVPWINAALAKHPALPGNLRRLRDAGVTFIPDSGLLLNGGTQPPVFPWQAAVDALPPVGESESSGH